MAQAQELIDFMVILLGVLAIAGVFAGVWFVAEVILKWGQNEIRHFDYMMTRKRWSAGEPVELPSSVS